MSLWESKRFLEIHFSNCISIEPCMRLLFRTQIWAVQHQRSGVLWICLQTSLSLSARCKTLAAPCVNVFECMGAKSRCVAVRTACANWIALPCVLWDRSSGRRNYRGQNPASGLPDGSLTFDNERLDFIQAFSDSLVQKENKAHLREVLCICRTWLCIVETLGFIFSAVFPVIKPQER